MNYSLTTNRMMELVDSLLTSYAFSDTYEPYMYEASQYYLDPFPKGYEYKDCLALNMAFLDLFEEQTNDVSNQFHSLIFFP